METSPIVSREVWNQLPEYYEEVGDRIRVDHLNGIVQESDESPRQVARAIVNHSNFEWAEWTTERDDRGFYLVEDRMNLNEGVIP